MKINKTGFHQKSKLGERIAHISQRGHEMVRICPECGDVIFYKTREGFNNASIGKSPCFKCHNKLKKGVSLKRTIDVFSKTKKVGKRAQYAYVKIIPPTMRGGWR